MILDYYKNQSYFPLFSQYVYYNPLCLDEQKMPHRNHYLKNHHKVGQVYWPGFKNHKNHHIAKKQMNAFGGMVSFTLKSNKLNDAINFVSNTHYFKLAESLGGVESLCGHPASMTHLAIPKSEREKTGVVDSLIRLSVGIEDVEDLINDLETAFSI